LAEEYFSNNEILRFIRPIQMRDSPVAIFSVLKLQSSCGDFEIIATIKRNSQVEVIIHIRTLTLRLWEFVIARKA
jgi:hypothetical protein